MIILEKIKLKFHWIRFILMYPKQYKKVTVFGPFSIIKPYNLSYGNNLTLNDYCYINASHRIILGNNVAISSGAKLISVKLNFEDHNNLKGEMKHVGSSIRIGNDVQIGANAVILPGVNICDKVIIGAGAIVSKSISKSGVYVGIPAKKI